MLKLEITRGVSVGRTFESDAGEIRIGRAPESELSLSDEHVSGEHARIVRTADRYLLRDLRSTNGTALVRRGERIALDDACGREAPLETDDRIELGAGDHVVEIVVTLPVERDDAHLLTVRPVVDIQPTTTTIEQGGRLHVLYDAQKRIGATEGLSEVLEAIADSALDLVPRATHVTLVLRDDDDDPGRSAGPASYIPILTRMRGQTNLTGPIPVTRSVFRKVVSERAAVIAADALHEVGQSESLMGAQIRSTLAVPLWRGEEILGVIQLDNRVSAGMFTSADLEIVAVLAHNASLAVANARLVKRLRAAEDRLKKENAFLKGREESRRTGGKNGQPEIIGQSTAMKALIAQLDKVVDTKVTVLVEGETGVGKELIAASVHYRSRRRDKLFVGQNCAAMPENLLESELFGHKKGSFTGAHEEKKGLFEIADGGTLFLDEVTEMPPVAPVQAPARAAGGGDPARRGDAGAQGQRPHRRRDQPEPREGGGRGALPRGPLLPPEGLPAARPAACASGARTSRSWPATSCSATPPRWARPRPASRSRRWSCSRATPGRATSASCRTRCRGSSSRSSPGRS